MVGEERWTILNSNNEKTQRPRFKLAAHHRLLKTPECRPFRHFTPKASTIIFDFSIQVLSGLKKPLVS